MTADSETIRPEKPLIWGWLLAGALYGLFLRLIFELTPGWMNLNGVMSVGFLFGAPFVAGALTVHGARNHNPSIWFVIFGPWATVALMLAGAAAALLEGSICIALMSPLFLVCGTAGGVLMAIVQKFSGYHGTNLGVFAVLPFALLAGEQTAHLNEKNLEFRDVVIIDASPERIWREILDAREIQSHELPFSVTHLIGVPRPVEGVNKMTENGEIRFSVWERGVNFQGAVTHREENRSIRWEYLFDSHSFPEGSMDEHVAIGGRFFDLQDTTFNLTELAPGRTQLEIIAHCRVSSSVNVYAVPAAGFLGRDFINTILHLYKGRSER